MAPADAGSPTGAAQTEAAPWAATVSQERAIHAPLGPALVLAGPGAGKTFCLIERINALVAVHGIDPSRICAFTFTNKAATEIAQRLESRLRHRASHVRCGTIHAFCAQLLRENPRAVGLSPGFGIADDEYQLTVLDRLEGRKRWHKRTLTKFSAHRLRGDPLDRDAALFAQYEQYLAERGVVDFDTLVLKAASLLGSDLGPRIRANFDAILVDEFQDLNPAQYQVVQGLARGHRHIFGVGDDEQSIYSWTGADPAVFRSFMNDFGIAAVVRLDENWRCPGNVIARARRLMEANTPLFDRPDEQRTQRTDGDPITVVEFETDDDESSWLVADLMRVRHEETNMRSDVAVLYRKHAMGERFESALLNESIPCRLAHGHALVDDPTVGYVIAALRVIANPGDGILRDILLGKLLTRTLFYEARAKADVNHQELSSYLGIWAAQLGRKNESSREIRRALAALRNLPALEHASPTLGALVEHLLAHRVGPAMSPLADRHDELTDPAALSDVAALAARLREARESRCTVWLKRAGGVEIPLKAVLASIGFADVRIGNTPPANATVISPDDTPSVGYALGVFKAAQLVETGDGDAGRRDFTTIDIETTERNTGVAEVVEIAAVRVRDGQIVEKFHALVRPRRAITPGAISVHRITNEQVASAAYFDEVWPAFRMFCGYDMIIAHNGYDFDFPVLERMVHALDLPFDLCTYDTLPLARSLFNTSCKLSDLANQFGIDPGQSHCALDDTLALAHVNLALERTKLARSRKTCLGNVLDHLGVALALSDRSTECAEAAMLRGITRIWALSRYSSCLEFYEREQGDELSVPTVDEVIEQLGGAALMHRVRLDKTAEDRYPAALARLRRLLHAVPDEPLARQLTLFLERVALSKHDGQEPDGERVHLLTLHATKGLEFSHVYIIGVEDSELPGATERIQPTSNEIEEARRLLYVGMTRTKARLVITRCLVRDGKPTGGRRFLDELGVGSGAPRALAQLLA